MQLDKRTAKNGTRFRGVAGRGIVGTNTLCIEFFRQG
jgi:hypothetical protein